MSKSKKPLKSREAFPKLPAQSPPAPPPQPQTYAVRETVESIVIAFVLAFLFRTFEAEAFVIPTGSMAPTLMGRHKDVECPKCGYRYQVSASEEESQDAGRPSSDCLAGMCPICHYVLPMTPNLPGNLSESRASEDIDYQRSYNGDRILVNKYIYTFSDPQRWDVVVFKYPGNAQINYIKRLVGLPNEKLRIYQGDLFVGDPNASSQDDFEIARKPADKVLAMRHLVHDTDYDSAELYSAGWPLRWRTTAGAAEGQGWQVETTIDGINVRQRYKLAGEESAESWLRYEHIVPGYHFWRRLDALRAEAAPGVQPELTEAEREQLPPRLITDANPYNAREDRHHLHYPPRRVSDPNSLEIDQLRQGIHWVGDLVVEADVEVQQPGGELLLDLVEAGQHFQATIDLSTGAASLSAAGAADYAPTGQTPIKGPGTYRVALANVDDKLFLWVDGDLVEFDGDTAYDAGKVFGDRPDIRPKTSAEDPGDFAPAGIGGRDAKLTVTRLRLWRDIYYIADNSQNNENRIGNLITDFDQRSDRSLLKLAYDPSLWEAFAARRHVDFPLGKDQFFVMGDNSAESSDARLWYSDAGMNMGRPQPGGSYLERKLLIGKALCVYWPHSWHRIPGTPIPFPLFPNFEDMRLVR